MSRLTLTGQGTIRKGKSVEMRQAILRRLRSLAQCPDCRTEIQKPLNCFPEPGPLCEG